MSNFFCNLISALGIDSSHKANHMFMLTINILLKIVKYKARVYRTMSGAFFTGTVKCLR